MYFPIFGYNPSMIITLGGHLGSGKSTLWKKLAEHFGLKRYSTGDFMRELALERGVSIIELNQIAETDGGVIDSILDERQKKLWAEQDEFIIDGRLAFHFIPHGKKIFLTVTPEEAAKRIFADNTRKGLETHESIDDAARNITIRRESENERYMKYYGVHIYDMSLYDIVIDTNYKTPEQVFDAVIQKLQTL